MSRCNVQHRRTSISDEEEPHGEHLSREVAAEMVRVKQADVPLFQQEGTTCCYAKADKFWVKDADGIPWEMYTLLEDVEAETAADQTLRRFLEQDTAGPSGTCC